MIANDFDGTLIHSVDINWAGSLLPDKDTLSLKERIEKVDAYGKLSRDEKMALWRDFGYTIFEYEYDTYVVRARPHAAEYLAECAKLSSTIILTAGLTKFQARVAKQLGLVDRSNYRELYGRDRYAAVPKTAAAVLVDDLWWDTSGVQEKLKALDSKQHICCKCWDGKDLGDNHLMEQILPELIKLYG